MRVLDRGRLRQQREKRAALVLAKRTAMRNHAVMARRQLRTKDYSEEARKHLGKAVEAARRAAGYRFRTDFCKAHGIRNLRGLEMLEQGQPGVGQAFLFEVAAALPGWDEDAPRRILEGGPAPAAEPAEVEALELGGRGMTIDEELAIIKLLRRRRWSDEAIDRALDRLGEGGEEPPAVGQRSGTDR